MPPPETGAGLHRVAAWCGLAFGIFFAISTLIGMVRSYSPVPFYDSWGAILRFHADLQAGDWSAWWQLHNEHRIVVPRVLYAAAMHFFSGSNAFLLVCNAALLGTSIAVAIRAALREFTDPSHRLFAAGLILVLLTSWAQERNLTWELQSQFWGVFAFAALAFAALERTVRTDRAAPFACTLVAASLAVYCLGNGIVVFPILLAQAAMLGVSRRKLGLLALVFALNLIPILFQADVLVPETRTESNGSISIAETLHGFVRNLGGPVLHAAATPAGLWIGNAMSNAAWVVGLPVYDALAGVLADFTGTAVIASAVLAFLHAFRRRTIKPAPTFFLAMLAFALASSLLIALGRSGLGFELTADSKYMTPPLLAWLGLSMLGLHATAARTRARRFVTALALTSCALLAPIQFDALVHDYAPVKFGRNTAALALQRGINDDDMLRRVHPRPADLPAMAEAAIRDRKSVFAAAWMPREFDVWPPANLAGSPLDGEVELTSTISDPAYVRVDGWLQSPHPLTTTLLVLSGADDRIVGYAITGPALSNGRIAWRGYLQSGAASGGGILIPGGAPAVRVHWPDRSEAAAGIP